VDHNAPARLQDSANAREQCARIAHEREHPPAPGGVECAFSHQRIVQLLLLKPDACDAACLRLRACDRQEPLRTIERKHFAIRRDHPGNVHRGVTGAAAHVEHALTRADAGPLPRGKRACAPDRVLQAESFDFCVVCAQHIFPFAHCAPCLASPPATEQ
jgi:hypothetical protein